MGWSTDFFDDFTYGTDISNVMAGINTLHSKRLLRLVVEQLELTQFGQKQPIPEGGGNAIDFFRWLQPANSISARTLTDGKNPNAMAVRGQRVAATLGIYGGFSQPGEFLRQAHIDRGLRGIVDIQAEDAAITIDKLTWREISANGGYCLPADYDTDTETSYEGTVTGITSTTVFAASALETNTGFGDTDDDLNQAILTWTGGANKGIARAVSDYATSGGAITVSPALENSPVIGDTFHVATPDAITASDGLSYKNIKKARTILRINRAIKFKGNVYVGLMDPDQEAALMDDDDWKKIQTYKDRTRGIETAALGMYGGIMWYPHTSGFKFPINTTRAQANNSYGPGIAGANQTDSFGTGYVGSVPIFGKECFGVTTFTKKKGRIRKPPIIIKRSDSGDTSNALNMYYTVGWKLEFVPKALNSLHMVNIWVGT